MTASVKDYFNSNMVTIIIFLAILSTMLIYSLMLQDVTSKTYEYGMLRALGFKKLYQVEVISLKKFQFLDPRSLFGDNYRHLAEYIPARSHIY